MQSTQSAVTPSTSHPSPAEIQSSDCDVNAYFATVASNVSDDGFAAVSEKHRIFRRTDGKVATVSDVIQLRENRVRGPEKVTAAPAVTANPPVVLVKIQLVNVAVVEAPVSRTDAEFQVQNEE